MLLLLSCASAPPSRNEAAPTPLDTGERSASQPAPLQLEPLPANVLFEVFDASSSYRLRLDAQGRWLEAWSSQQERVREPWEPLPPHPDAARSRADTTVETWRPLLRSLDGQEIASNSKGRGTNGRQIEADTLVFRVRSAERVYAVRATGDLTFPATLGPLEAVWRDLSRQIYGPQP